MLEDGNRRNYNKLKQRFSTKVDGRRGGKEEKQKDKVKELSIYKKQLSYWVRERICLVHQRAVDI